MSKRKCVQIGKVVTRTSLLAFSLALLAWPLAAAQKAEPSAKIEASANLFFVEPLIAYAEVRVTISGPGGFEVVKTFGAGETPSVDLPGLDGFYKYELRFSPALSDEEREALMAARETGAEFAEVKASTKRMVQAGSFSLAGGSVVPDLREPEPDKVVLTNGDGVIRNSLCVGFDCPDAPLFDDSTILLMENNTRIKFGDTSNAPFPNNDWEIEANSNLSGGANYLGFNDCGTADNDGGCATDLVFAVESGARASALYVESDGDVGLGTSNPVVDFHLVIGNTPTLRLDQDGSSGFAPQVWDIAGNETNFFIRDVTGGSLLPFRIRPGAPTSSIDIAADGDVGIGASAPQGRLHVENTSGNDTDDFVVTSTGRVGIGTVAPTTLLEIETGADNTGRMRFEETVTGHDWEMGGGAGNTFVILDPADASEFTLDLNGNLTIAGGLVTGTVGSCTVATPCDGIFSPEYEVESIEEHAEFMWQNSHLRGVGPTPDDAAQINLTSKTTGILHELEKAHIYIEQLNNRLNEKDGKITELQQRLARLEELLISKTTEP